MESQIDKSFVNSNITIGNMLRFRTNPKFSAIVIDVIRKIIHKFKFLQTVIKVQSLIHQVYE